MTSDSLLAQNLVPNGDFNISKCPAKKGELAKAVGWYSPTIGTTDHFHLCGSNDVKIGTNAAGYQMPAKGYGYAMFFGVYIWPRATDTIYHLTREYLECEFPVALEEGALYSYSMKIVLAEYANYVSNRIGADFSMSGHKDYSATSYLPIYLEPEIEFEQLVTDTQNWVTLIDTFKASDNFKFLTIGVFADSTDLEFVQVGYVSPDAGCGNFIDDIQLIKIRDALKIRKDTAVCDTYTDSITLKATSGFADYAWYDAASKVVLRRDDSVLKVKPAVTTVYMVIAEGDTAYATITVNSLPRFSLGADTNLCDYNTIVLQSGLNPSKVKEYQWASNSTSSIYTADKDDGLVWHQITDKNGCVWRDTINLAWQTPPALLLENDKQICAGESTSLQAKVTSGGSNLWSANYNIVWQTDATLVAITDSTAEVTPKESTRYFATVDDGKCTGNTDSVMVIVQPNPVTTISPHNISICEGQHTTITASGGDLYQWNMGGTVESPSAVAQKTFTGVVSSFVAVQAIQAPCIGQWDTAYILVDSAPLQADFSVTPDRGTTVFEPVVLNTSVGAGNNEEMYAWDFGNGDIQSVTSAADIAQGRTYSPRYILAGDYQLSLTASRVSGCRDSIQKRIIVTKNFILEIPNAFTPNADQLNDVWNITTSAGTKVEGEIYNRWGEQVYMWNTADGKVAGWNGFYKGELAQEGVYTFVLKIRELDNTVHFEKGIIHLIR